MATHDYTGLTEWERMQQANPLPWLGDGAREGTNTTLNTGGVDWNQLAAGTAASATTAAPAASTGQRFLADWAYGGDQLGNGQYVNGAWQNGPALAAGFDLASNGVARGGGFNLPTGYDSRQDTGRYELNGKVVETGWSRVLRKAQDLYVGGTPWQQAFNQSLALVTQEAAAQGKTTGFGATTAPAQTGQTAQAGGAAMVAPALGSGMVQGGAAAVGAQEARPGQSNPQYNNYLMNNKAGRMAALMARLGFGNPMRSRSVFGSTVGGRLGKMLDPWIDTQGIAGGNVADNYSGLIDKFVGNFENGGGGMGAIAGDAQNAARTIASDPRYSNMEDPELIAMLQSMSQLANSTQNEWLQRAYGNVQDDSVQDFYTTVDKAAQSGGDPAGIRYLPYVRQNPLFAFLTGQR